MASATPAKKNKSHTPLVASEAAKLNLHEGSIVWAATEEYGWAKCKVRNITMNDFRGRVLSVGPDDVDIELLARKHVENQAGKRVKGVLFNDLLPVSELDDDVSEIGDVLDLQVSIPRAAFTSRDDDNDADGDDENDDDENMNDDGSHKTIDASNLRLFLCGSAAPRKPHSKHNARRAQNFTLLLSSFNPPHSPHPHTTDKLPLPLSTAHILSHILCCLLPFSLSQVLHDAAVYETLRLRYFEDKIYTQVLRILLLRAISLCPPYQMPGTAHANEMPMGSMLLRAFPVYAMGCTVY
eukprot:626279-Rhodomonas_salina.1